MSSDGTVSFEKVHSIAESELAVLCIIEGKEHWIPKSQIHDDSEVWGRDQIGELVITEWFAIQKGLV